MLINVPVSKLMLSISKAIFKNDASFIFTLLVKRQLLYMVYVALTKYQYGPPLNKVFHTVQDHPYPEVLAR